LHAACKRYRHIGVKVCSIEGDNLPLRIVDIAATD
jgi:hypothetical protein